MNRLGKGFRLTGGIFALINVVLFFLPMTQSVRVNYPTKIWSQLSYVTQVTGDGEPYLTGYTTERLMWVGGLIVLPLLLSALTGIWGIVGDDRQLVSPLMSFVVLGLYIGLFMTVSFYYPDATYERAFAGAANLICSGLAAAFGLFGIFWTAGRTEAEMTEIPQVQEFKQEQIESRYNIIDTTPQKGGEAKEGEDVEGVTLNMQSLPEDMKQKAAEATDDGLKNIPPYQGPPRGVMVGLTGMYAGAEIPFQDGEQIRMGRFQDNELIFDESQNKVSRNHCIVKWNAKDQEYLVFDTSTNGTYPYGAEDCLPKNLEVIVKPGTIIGIGDFRNSFRLE